MSIALRPEVLTRWTLFGLAAIGGAYSTYALVDGVRRFDGSVEAQTALAGIIPITAALLVALSYLARSPFISPPQH